MRRPRILILLIAAAVRLSTWTKVFTAGRTFIDGPDGYYHLRRAFLAMQQWPRVPSTDSFMSVPAGGRISWPPLFDGLLATLAMPWRSSPFVALERIGALLPPILGVLQVALIMALTAKIATRRAAIAAGFVAALLPSVVRYTLVGALDHDPFFECALLLALLGIASDRIGATAAGLTLAVLGWTGSIVGIFIVIVAACVRKTGRTLFVASMIAGVVVLPFVIMSPWPGATFEGLSWLHETALMFAALAGALLMRRAIAIAIPLAALLALLPISVVPAVRGFFYAAGDAAILKGVAEAQPLLFLFGRFDLWPALIRFGFLPLLAIVIVRRRENALVTSWVAITFALALMHSRFSYSAASALAVAAGIAIDQLWGQTRVSVLHAIAFAPMLIAYAPVPGFEAFNFYERTNPFVESGAPAACDFLRRCEPEDPALRDAAQQPAWSVMAPWYHGHWIMWSGQRATVISPMLSVGQPAFNDGMRFFVEPDETSALEILKRHRVRYVLVVPDLRDLTSNATMIGARPPRDIRTAMHVVPVRLAFWGPNGAKAFGDTYPPLPFVEVWRSSVMRIYKFEPR